MIQTRNSTHKQQHRVRTKYDTTNQDIMKVSYSFSNKSYTQTNKKATDWYIESS